MAKCFKDLKARHLTDINRVNDPKFSSDVLNRHFYLNGHRCSAARELNVVWSKLQRVNRVIKYKVINAVTAYARLTISEVKCDQPTSSSSHPSSSSPENMPAAPDRQSYVKRADVLWILERCLYAVTNHNADDGDVSDIVNEVTAAED
uniref:Uncharacterized protein n=1 Tax=Glossina austeni TaxID=7395 RepID=A0A1A9V770_GLOAU